MTDGVSFADRIRERYPEGLTGIIAIGGTRTTFIMEHNQRNADPGKIPDLSAYANALLPRYLDLVKAFFDLGGQNLIVPLLAYQLFFDKGQKYAQAMSEMCLRLIDEDVINFYKRTDTDPYFVGIDTLLRLPEDHFGYKLASQLTDFQKSWDYQPGRHKLIWEIAPIPLFSFWQAAQTMGQAAQAELDAQLAGAHDLQTIHDRLYHYYAQAAYGTDLPIPHFYLGTNRNGDLKLRSMLPIAMICGGPFRLYYTPYPSLFTKPKTLQAILEDLAFGKTLSSTKRVDYSGKITAEEWQAEYERVEELAANPDSTVGMVRQGGSESDD